LTSLSEQMLVDCVQNGQFTCNNGGDEGVAFTWVIRNGGAVSEASYPYLATSGHKCGFNVSQVVAKFSKTTNLRPRGDEKNLANTLALKPTVSVAMDASHRSFQSYSKGIYQDSACMKANSDLDHAILSVGYGVDPSTNLSYWLLKNSWGTSWGIKGYFWMLKDGTGTSANMCGVATDANYIEV